MKRSKWKLIPILNKKNLKDKKIKQRTVVFNLKMANKIYWVYNGKKYFKVLLDEEKFYKLYYKFGNFSYTRGKLVHKKKNGS